MPWPRTKQSDEESGGSAWSRRVLDEMYETLSHGFREPTRMVSIYLQLLERSLDSKLTPQEHELIRLARLSEDQMYAMTCDLTNYLELAQRELCWERVDLREIMDLERGNLEPALSHISLSITGDPEPVVFCDRRRMDLLFRQLFLNSIAHQRNPPFQIEVCFERQSVGWQIHFRDNGCGFDPEFRNRMFEMFQRLDSKERGGLGMGLALVRLIVEQHGGLVRAESDGCSYCNVIFTLPNQK